MNYLHTALLVLGYVSGAATLLGNLMMIVPSWRSWAGKVLAFGVDLQKVAGSS